jgi:hypothetical protein
MNKTCEYTIVGARTRKAVIGNHAIMMIHEDGEFSFYLKRRESENTHDWTPYMFMYSVPVDQDPAPEALDIAVANIDNYDFLFEDEHWMTPFTVPVFHPACRLHECSDCGSAIDASQKFCPECGHKICWEMSRTDS